MEGCREVQGSQGWQAQNSEVCRGNTRESRGLWMWKDRVMKKQGAWEEQWPSVQWCSQIKAISQRGSQRSKCSDLTLLPASLLQPSLPSTVSSRKLRIRDPGRVAPTGELSRAESRVEKEVDWKGPMMIIGTRSNIVHDHIVKIMNNKWYLVVQSKVLRVY